ncbi:hypothetical protein CP532_6979 [Ophiocordyceps camponoti-leonardi (nom. inval.)]|nr:hypothetical protein CP532_6979 [Ophiocordyceps camponoti-leonardi (nom. inval.)]
MATQATARNFFASPAFAVVGASSNPAKFGHKGKRSSGSELYTPPPALTLSRGSRVVTVRGVDYATVPSLSALPSPRQTAVSIITPPAVTRTVLDEARKLGVPAVWMQPGSFDDAVLDFALADGAFETVVYGSGGRGEEGWCVLVDGEKALKDAGKL